ncbi:hypothetical protein AGLY_002764 [Aphis glycines]|uniref:Gustatory receptor n=1 Tax=Aphis glycines TaxID=307491 RepID=A0A6G0U1N8_APHGL|nr:hypothetical protein AGLY_002764 [Aphis glycines]
MPLLSHLSVKQRSISIILYWNIFYFLLIMYLIVYRLLTLYLFPPRTPDINFVANFFIGPPFIVHYVIFISTCYFLYNLYIRFKTLNDLWKCLPVGLIAAPDQWTHSEVVILIDNIRFEGYGPMFITFFASNYIDTLIQFYFVYNFGHFQPEYNLTKNLLRIILIYIAIGQSIVVVMIIIMLASFVNDKIKMFMNQVSVYESNEITAFGLFKINLNLVMSILALIITGIATSIQMKEHPIVLRWMNEIFAIATLNLKNVMKSSSESPVH